MFSDCTVVHFFLRHPVYSCICCRCILIGHWSSSPQRNSAGTRTTDIPDVSFPMKNFTPTLVTFMLAASVHLLMALVNMPHLLWCITCYTFFSLYVECLCSKCCRFGIVIVDLQVHHDVCTGACPQRTMSSLRKKS